ncbi:hypothetical protein QF012_005958 [Pseudomonas laurylsulfatiphila]
MGIAVMRTWSPMADCIHSGAIINASVILMNSSFLSMTSRAQRTLSATARSVLLDPVRQFQNGGLQGELAFVELE